MPVIDHTPHAQVFRCDECAYVGQCFPNGMTGSYGSDRAGRTYCISCCHARDLASVTLGEPTCSYVSSDGLTVGTWHGMPLMRVESLRLVRRYTWNEVWQIHARDRQGRRWTGRGGGKGMYCNLKLAKKG